MDKDNSTFDFDNDQEFNENFYKNIEKALGDHDSLLNESEMDKKQTANQASVNAKASIQDDADQDDAKLSQEEAAPIENEKALRQVEDTQMADQLVEKTDVEDGTEPAGSAIASEEQPLDETDTKGIESPSEAVSQESLPPSGDAAVENSSSADSEEEDDIDDKLVDINSSLAKQISEELDNEADAQTKKLKKKRLLRIQSGIALTLLCLAGIGFFFCFTKPGNQLLMKMGLNVGGTLWGSMTNEFEDSAAVSADVDDIDQDDLNSDATEIDPSTIVWPDHPGEGRQEDGVYNILLLGEEAIGMGDSRGHTDVIVIATMNTNDKSLKLTSIMRDTLVQIPGFKENRLNVAYEEGGLDLLYETIALNFDIRLDGCVKVNFENFEKIIDAIGGVEITLTDNEVEYLNSTNYISDPKNRNVVVGTQLMNGNQVLGYARVRKTSTITGNNNDYGRTDRHRIVLNAIFEKCKNMSKTELLSLMFKFLPMITTDIDSQNFQMLLNSFIDMGMNTKTIQQLRIPVDGSFEDNVKVRGMAVLIPDLEANIAALHSFIFGDAVATVTPGATEGTDQSSETETATNQ